MVACPEQFVLTCDASVLGISGVLSQDVLYHLDQLLTLREMKWTVSEYECMLRQKAPSVFIWYRLHDCE